VCALPALASRSASSPRAPPHAKIRPRGHAYTARGPHAHPSSSATLLGRWTHFAAASADEGHPAAQDPAEGWSAGTMGEDLFAPPFAAQSEIDPACFELRRADSPSGADVAAGGLGLLPQSRRSDRHSSRSSALPGNMHEPTARELVDSDHEDAALGPHGRHSESGSGSANGAEFASRAAPSVVRTCSHTSRLEDGALSVGGADPERVLVVMEVVEAAEGGAQVAVRLYVGELPDPNSSGPSTPPLASSAVSLEAVFEMMQEQVHNAGNGWGVLMSDVRAVLTPAKFQENAGTRHIPAGFVTWPVFVRTVLHLLHR
jgi:hypothetical protein